MAWASPGVRVLLLPVPWLTPLFMTLPACTTTVLAPMLASTSLMEADEPLPISTMAMRAAMPMMMPSVVSTERRMFRRRACAAMCTGR